MPLLYDVMEYDTTTIKKALRPERLFYILCNQFERSDLFIIN